MTDRFMPVVDELSADFLHGAAQGRLLIQKCGACGQLRFPPALACLECHSFATETIESSGRGFVWSYAYPVRPRWDFLPEGTALVVVELEEGVRVPTNVTGVAPADMHIGLPVEVWFEQLAEGIALPMFRPSPVADSSSASDSLSA